jgi:hypothetical protein
MYDSVNVGDIDELSGFASKSLIVDDVGHILVVPPTVKPGELESRGLTPHDAATIQRMYVRSV